MKQRMIAKAVGSALLSAAAFVSAPAFSADAVSTTLKVTGKLTPGACNVSIAGGNRIDYGNIASAELSPTQYTALPVQARGLAVVCGSSTNAYVSVNDSQAPSALADAEIKQMLGDKALADAQVFGLGTTGDGTTKIGAYSIVLGPATTLDLNGEQTQQQAVLSSADKKTWSAARAVFMTGGDALYYSTGNAAAGSAPVRGKAFLFPFAVKAALNNTENMPVSSKVALDGSATFTVSYN